jgi:hypothetical protein
LNAKVLGLPELVIADADSRDQGVFVRDVLVDVGYRTPMPRYSHR